MSKVKVWKRTDGGVSVTHFDLTKKDAGETDEAFIERKSVKLRLQSNLQGAVESVVDSSELPVRDENRNKWRVNAQGKVFVDQTIELPREARTRKLNSAKAKFISGQALSPEEADEVTKDQV